jgi:hypothetical protein
MTNDFVALLKDSSLVSVLTVVELTKETQMFATNLGSWVIPGALCAALASPCRCRSPGWPACWNGDGDGARVSGGLFSMNGVELTRGGRVIVTAVNLDAQPGELIVLRGPSGSGKTTILLRAVAGLDPFHEGAIHVGDAAAGGRPGAGRAMLQAAPERRLRLSVSLPVRTYDGAAERVSGADPCVSKIGARRRNSERASFSGSLVWKRGRRPSRASCPGRGATGGDCARWPWTRPCC